MYSKKIFFCILLFNNILNNTLKIIDSKKIETIDVKNKKLKNYKKMFFDTLKLSFNFSYNIFKSALIWKFIEKKGIFDVSKKINNFFNKIFIDDKYITETKEILVKNYNKHIYINIFKSKSYYFNFLNLISDSEKSFLKSFYNTLIHEFSHSIVNLLLNSSLACSINLHFNYKLGYPHGGFYESRSSIKDNNLITNSLQSIFGIIGGSFVEGKNSIYSYSDNKKTKWHDILNFNKNILTICMPQKNKIFNCYEIKNLIIEESYKFFSKNIYKILEIVNNEFIKCIDYNDLFSFSHKNFQLYKNYSNSILKNKSYSISENKDKKIKTISFKFSNNSSHKIFNDMKIDFNNMIENIKNKLKNEHDIKI